MGTISLCMIVKNEEAVLARCLDSVKGLVDEMVIVDTGSSDRTKEIARQYTGRMFDFPWKEDFSAARNFSFSQAAMDYCYQQQMLRLEERQRWQQAQALLAQSTESAPCAPL